jgi:hypothetical protein
MPSAVRPIYKVGIDYVVTDWGREDSPEGVHPNYECARCQFATLDPQTFNEHMKQQDHSRWAWPKKGEIILNEGTDEEKVLEVNGYHPMAKENPFTTEKPPVRTRR